MARDQLSLLSLSILTALVAGIAATCAHPPLYDYRSADPVAAARCSLIDSGYFHFLALRLDGKILVPTDTTKRHGPFSVEVRNGKLYQFLKLDPAPGHPDRPSDEQIVFMRRFNSAMVAFLDSNWPLPEGLPPNQRLKLSGCGGRQNQGRDSS